MRIELKQEFIDKLRGIYGTALDAYGVTFCVEKAILEIANEPDTIPLTAEQKRRLTKNRRFEEKRNAPVSKKKGSKK